MRALRANLDELGYTLCSEQLLEVAWRLGQQVSVAPELLTPAARFSTSSMMTEVMTVSQKQEENVAAQATSHVQIVTSSVSLTNSCDSSSATFGHSSSALQTRMTHSVKPMGA